MVGQTLRGCVAGEGVVVGGIEKKKEGKKKPKNSWTWTAVWDCQGERLEKFGSVRGNTSKC